MDFVWRLPVKMISRTRQVFKMHYISNVFILNELKQFKRNKATGIDGLPLGLQYQQHGR